MDLLQLYNIKIFNVYILDYLELPHLLFCLYYNNLFVFIYALIPFNWNILSKSVSLLISISGGPIFVLINLGYPVIISLKSSLMSISVLSKNLSVFNDFLYSLNLFWFDKSWTTFLDDTLYIWCANIFHSTLRGYHISNKSKTIIIITDFWKCLHSSESEKFTCFRFTDLLNQDILVLTTL